MVVAVVFVVVGGLVGTVVTGMAVVLEGVAVVIVVVIGDVEDGG
jgi:hypothetical protein